MSYRGNLTYNEQSLHNPDPGIPQFVLKKIRSVLDWRADAAGEKVAGNTFFYAETQGCVTESWKDVSKHIMIWIASHDCLVHSIYPGGSSVWIEPESHYLSFKAIPEQDLPPLRERDPFTWWIVSNPDEGPWPQVVRIQIVAEEEMNNPFPDL